MQSSAVVDIRTKANVLNGIHWKDLLVCWFAVWVKMLSQCLVYE